MNRAFAGAALAALLLSTSPARAQSASPPASVGDAELYVWKRATASGRVADYQDYLRFYPDGKFASLAQMRVQGAGGQAATPSAPAPTRPYPVPPEMTIYHLDVTPPTVQPPQLATVRTRGFPAPALFDLLVLVPAAARDFAPDGSLDETQFRVKALANLYDLNAGVTLPTQPPGQYEVRYISRAFNPDGRLEVIARSAVIWGDH